MCFRRLTLTLSFWVASLILITSSTGCGSAPHPSLKAAQATKSVYPVLGRYTAIYMLKKYEGEDEPLIDMGAYDSDQQTESGEYEKPEEPVKYWDDKKRAAHKISVKNGVIIDIQGNPLDPQLDIPEHKDRGGEAIYIMDVMGNIYYSFDPKYGHTHHSSLAGGRPVAAAGELVVINGELISVSNESGHYRPPPATIELVVGRFQELGVNVENVKRFALEPKKGVPPPERVTPENGD